MSYKVSIIIEKDEYGYYAYCPEVVPFHSNKLLHPKIVKQVFKSIEGAEK